MRWASTPDAWMRRGLMALALIVSLDSGAVLREQILPITPVRCVVMALPVSAPVGCGELRRVEFIHLDFSGRLQQGTLVVHQAVAGQVLALFRALRQQGFPIALAREMTWFGNDDQAAMAANNTSGFNARPITGRATEWSAHAYGMAIDINPWQNPYIAEVLDRLPPRLARRGYAEALVDLFAAHGFGRWGGRWREPVDYQHFEVTNWPWFLDVGAARGREWTARQSQRLQP